MLKIFSFASYFLPSVLRLEPFKWQACWDGEECCAQSCSQVCIVPKSLPPAGGGPGHSCTAGALPPGSSQHALPAGKEAEKAPCLPFPGAHRKPEGETPQSALALLWNLQEEADYRTEAMVLLLFSYEFAEPETLWNQVSLSWPHSPQSLRRKKSRRKRNFIWARVFYKCASLFKTARLANGLWCTLRVGIALTFWHSYTHNSGQLGTLQYVTSHTIQLKCRNLPTQR